MVAPLSVQIDRASAVPLYLQLADQLLDGISSGRLRPGDLVETEVDLARRLRLSRPTVRRAIAELVSRGLLVRRRGIGTVVATGGVAQNGQLNSLYDDLVATARSPRTSLLELSFADINPRAAGILGLAPRTPLVHVTRLRLIGSLPLAILENWLPPTCPALPLFTPSRLESEGLYAILRSAGVRPHSARQTFGARNATGAERRLLGLTRADPLLTMSRRAFDEAGDIIECGAQRYRGDQYTIDVEVAEAAAPTS